MKTKKAETYRIALTPRQIGLVAAMLRATKNQDDAELAQDLLLERDAALAGFDQADFAEMIDAANSSAITVVEASEGGR